MVWSETFKNKFFTRKQLIDISPMFEFIRGIIFPVSQLIKFVFLTIYLVLATGRAIADNNSLTLTVGAEYTTGNYGGEQSIDEWYVPFTGRYAIDKYVFRLTVPYISVTSPTGTIFSGVDGQIIFSGTGARTTESGLGDVIAGVTYRDVFNTEATSDIAIDFTGKIKFGTADENLGLGTGENDYTVQAELYKYIGSFTLFSTIGHKFRTDPASIDLRDSWLALVGGNYRFSQSISGGLDFYFQQASVSQTDDQKEMAAFMRYKLSKTRYLRGYLVQGFGDNSPDWGVGVLLSIKQ